jgi:4-amino-4-deoxy-L-arabinose transferase-like glycosyltransferase
MKIWTLLIICAGLYLSVANQSLWLDEAISANVANHNSYRGIVGNFSKYDFHPPLYYLVLKTWGDVFGYSEMSVRIPSIIFMLVTVYTIYLLGGIGSAMIVGLNPLLIYYSHEARMYSLATMLLTMALYFLVKKRYLLSGIIAGTSFLVFYGSVFLIVAIGIYLLIKKEIKGAVMYGVGPLIALLVIYPLLSAQMKYSKEMLTTVTNWSLVLGKANIKNILLIPMKFAGGRISFYPKAVYYVIVGSWSLVVFLKLIKRNKYSFIFWLTLILGVVFSMFTPMLSYFRFLYLIPIMGLIIGKNRMVAIGSLLFGLVYIVFPSFHREDWKTMARELPNKVYMIESFGDPVKYYRSDIKVVEVRKEFEDREITVIPYGEMIHGFDHNQYLSKLGFVKVGEKKYREVGVENWKKN